MKIIEYPDQARIFSPFLDLKLVEDPEPIGLDLTGVEDMDFFELQKILALITYRKQLKRDTQIMGVSDYVSDILSRLNLTL